MLKKLGVVVSGGLLLIACENLDGTDGGNNNNPDGGTEVTCPGPLPSAAVTCTAAECTASGTKRFGEAEMASSAGKSWIIPVWSVSEVAGANDNGTFDYTMEMTGGLTPARARRTLDEQRALRTARSEAFLGEEAFAHLFRPERAERVRAEAAIRAAQHKGDVSFEGVTGTAIRGRTAELLPPGVHRQATACSAAAPSCGAAMLCVIPEGTTDGTCESGVTLKFNTGSSIETVNATVKRVGTYGAIILDDANATALGDADATELLDRFDNHIAPLDHQFFGEPRDSNGRDRDGNGVVIFFVTSRVGQRNAALVGYFQPDDLLDTATEPSSNAADILYLQPPGGAVTLDAISGTIGHEYQHLINYYQKKILRSSGPEDVWLDEGIATFAEDMLGYGGDAFENIAAYLATLDQVSLTGAGLLSEEDSNQRRGMAHLLVRYVFEQGGGASFTGPGAATDRGGIAAVKKLVQSADTGTFLFTEPNTGRTFARWVADLMTTVAIDGAGYEDVSCNPMYSLRAPETDGYTGNQRGIDLRGSFENASGQRVNLNGPLTATLGNDTGIILPTNGGEMRTVDVASGMVKMTLSGEADYEAGFRPLPTAK